MASGFSFKRAATSVGSDLYSRVTSSVVVLPFAFNKYWCVIRVSFPCRLSKRFFLLNPQWLMESSDDTTYRTPRVLIFKNINAVVGLVENDGGMLEGTRAISRSRSRSSKLYSSSAAVTTGEFIGTFAHLLPPDPSARPVPWR